MGRGGDPSQGALAPGKVAMRVNLPHIIGIAGMLFIGSALAGSPQEEATVKAASDCVAATALNHLKISELHQQDKVKSITDWIVLKSGICDNQLASMRYILGSYFADLPRAVDERIRIEVAKRIASQSGDDYRAI
jgi:hypothetical protein